MASEREIERVRKDTVEWRAIIAHLLRLSESGGYFNEWELDFLESNSSREWQHELTYRQAEVLLELRDDADFVSSYMGFSLPYLIRGSHESRLDLDESKEDWIVGLFQAGTTSLRRRHARRLLRIAQEVGLVEDYMAA